MIGGILLAVLVGVVAVLAFYTWLDRFMVPMENWNVLAYAAGVGCGLLAFTTTVALAAGW